MPNKKKSVWEVYLRPNTLTKDNDRDCIADVYQHAETQRNADIADIIVKERTEFRPETIKKTSCLFTTHCTARTFLFRPL